MEEKQAKQPPALVAVQKLGLKFPPLNNTVLQDVSFEVKENSLFGLFGVSGGGKSSIGKIIAGFRPDPNPQNYSITGSVIWQPDGSDMLQWDERKWEREGRGCAVTLVPQDPQQLLNEYETIGRQQRRVQKDEMPLYPNIEGLQKLYPLQLSPGNRQKVAIGLALAVRPRLLILDEPMSCLEEKAMTEVMEKLRHARQTMTIIIITHRQELFAEMIDASYELEQKGA